MIYVGRFGAEIYGQFHCFLLNPHISSLCFENDIIFFEFEEIYF